MVICLLLISTTLYDWSDSSDRLCTTAIVSVAVLAGMLYTLLGIFTQCLTGDRAMTSDAMNFQRLCTTSVVTPAIICTNIERALVQWL